MEIVKEGTGPLENVEIDREAVIEAVNRAMNSEFYKNSLEMVKLQPRYNEKTVFQSRLTTEDVRKNFQEEVCKTFYKSGNIG